jgi:hypothetical protein
VRDTVNTLVPLIVENAPILVGRCESIVNSPVFLHNRLKNRGTLDNESEKLIKKILDFHSTVESQQISALIQRQITELLSDHVFSNGNSIYPDFIRHGVDYSRLPTQSRKKPVDGPNVKRTTKTGTCRPSNVPDGLELKTNRGTRLRVDAHGAHPGLHLGVTWEFEEGNFKVLGVYLSYIRISDHKMSAGNVAVTTKKASFGHSQFTLVYSEHGGID